MEYITLITYEDGSRDWMRLNSKDEEGAGSEMRRMAEIYGKDGMPVKMHLGTWDEFNNVVVSL